MGRIKASFTHFLISAFVVLTAMLVVFFVWYPTPYNETNDVIAIVKILVAVDLVLGPLLTLVVFNTKKPMRELKRDLTIIATVQLSALAFGLHTLHKERPVFVAFAVDRMDVVTASEVDASTSHKSVGVKPMVGPLPVFALPGQTAEEREKFLFDVLDGKPDIDRMPERYRPLQEHVASMRERALPVQIIVDSARITQQSAQAAELNDYAKANPTHFFLPLKGKVKSMIVALDGKTGLPDKAFSIQPWPAQKAAKKAREMVTAKSDDDGAGLSGTE